MDVIHPLIVHLPIGLLAGNAILTVLYLQRGDRALELGAYQCLWLGLLLLLPAVLSGVYDAARQLATHSDALGWINGHALVGLTLVAVYWSAWQRRRRNPALLDDQQARRGYLLRIGLGAALIMLEGWLGGRLVYSLGIGVGG